MKQLYVRHGIGKRRHGQRNNIAAVSVLYKDEIYASDNIAEATKAKALAYAKDVCGAAAAVQNGAADAVCAAADVRGAVAQALDMLASKRAVRLAKKHGNITL